MAIVTLPVILGYHSTWEATEPSLVYHGAVCSSGLWGAGVHPGRVSRHRDILRTQASGQPGVHERQGQAWRHPSRPLHDRQLHLCHHRAGTTLFDTGDVIASGTTVQARHSL